MKAPLIAFVGPVLPGSARCHLRAQTELGRVPACSEQK